MSSQPNLFRSNAVLLSLLLLLGAGCSTSSPANPKPTRRDLDAFRAKQAALTPQQVLQALKQGNQRFLSQQVRPRDFRHDQAVVAEGQYPHAILLSCIDSRAPAEIIFDTGLGDIFNSRVAGNIANVDQVGSIEFACKVAGAKLVLVMGHTACGAVKGACDDVQLGNITALLANIRPAVAAVNNVPGPRTSENIEFVEAVAVMNVRLTQERIRALSPILTDLESRGDIAIVGAIYDLATGKVNFLE